MRRAFDADHIAAIDNTTRKLVNEGKRPLSVGFFFSLGYSSVVFALAVLLNFGIRGLYPIGFLFGLGFNTAAEVALLVLVGTAVVGGLPFYATLS
jgi:high-affinity nickel permease